MCSGLPLLLMIKKGFAAGKRGGTGTNDASRWGRPKTASDEETVKQKERIKHEDFRVSTRSIAVNLKISRRRKRPSDSARRAMPEEAGKQNRGSRFSPQMNKKHFAEFSQANLRYLSHDLDYFWRMFINVDETWIHYFTVEHPESCRQWKCWPRCFGILRESYFWIFTPERNNSLIGKYYAGSLREVNERSRESRPNLRDISLLLHHDNGPVHHSANELWKIRGLNFATVPHKHYSQRQRCLLTRSLSKWFLLIRKLEKTPYRETTFDRWRADGRGEKLFLV